MKQLVLIVFLFACCNLIAQKEIETIVRYTNSYQTKKPKSEVYLVMGFGEDYLDYFFSQRDSCQVMIVGEDNSKVFETIKKSDLFYNKSTFCYEWYRFLCLSKDISEKKLFDLYIIPFDESALTYTSFDEKTRNKIAKKYGLPKANASNKQKLKYYKKTGDSQGQLMGDTQIINITKRKKCAVKKKEFRREGVNGVKEMTYGF